MKNGELPAYPTKKGEHDCQFTSGDVHGLTKREYFAGLAMQGILAGRNESIEQRQYEPEQVALWAMQQADELLKTLES